MPSYNDLGKHANFPCQYRRSQRQAKWNSLRRFHVLKMSFVALPSLAMVLTNSNEHSMLLLLQHDPQK